MRDSHFTLLIISGLFRSIQHERKSPERKAPEPEIELDATEGSRHQGRLQTPRKALDTKEGSRHQGRLQTPRKALDTKEGSRQPFREYRTVI